jgi:hypothetical protein
LCYFTERCAVGVTLLILDRDMGKRPGKKGYFRCPHCRARVRRGALACPKCGSDKETGWAVDAHKWAADIPTGYGEDDFDYDEFIEDDFPENTPQPTAGLRVHLFWLVVVVLLAGLALVWYLASN